MKSKFRYSQLTLLLSLLFVCSCQAQKEQYADLQFSPFNTQQKFHIEEDSTAPAASYKLKLFYASQGEEQTKNWLNKQLIHILFGEEYALQNLSFQEAAQQYTQAYKEEYLSDVTEPYLEQLKNEPDQMSHWYNYEFQSQAELISYQKDLLTLKTFTEMYSGGAHGMYSTNYFNFDLRNKALIYLADVFEEGYQTRLVELLLAQLKEDFQTEDLTEHMITASDVYPTENFLIGAEGITFCYTPYEIAAYAAGEIEVTLSYKQLKPLLHTAPESILQRM